MAKTRVINTRFWIDDYTSNLDPIEKLLFLYFLTNPATDICGIYEVPLKSVALDTGIDKEMVEKILKRFARDKKIYYLNGWVCIKNFIKHQSTNPKVEKGIQIGLEKAPKELRDKLDIAYDSLSHSNSNSNSNSNSKGAKAPRVEKVTDPIDSQIPEVIKEFETVDPYCKKIYGNTSQRKACRDLIENYGFEQVLKVIKILPQTNKMPYLPNIKTPVQLSIKWSTLEDGIDRLKSKQREKLNSVAF